MLLLGVVQAQAAGDEFVSSYDLLATEILTSATSSVTFSSLNTLAAGYQHLQIRMAHKVTSADNALQVQFNADTASNYNWHMLYTFGSSVESFAATNQASMRASYSDNTVFGSGVIDILDPFETTKNTTIRSLAGFASGSPRFGLFSGAWRNTSAVTEIKVFSAGGNIDQFTRFSLYGIKAV